MVIVTGADQGYYNALRNFAASLKYWAPERKLVVYNLGMSDLQLKDIPKPGTTMSWNGLQFQVEEATRRQVKRVRITLEIEPETDEVYGATTQVVSNA